MTDKPETTPKRTELLAKIGFTTAVMEEAHDERDRLNAMVDDLNTRLEYMRINREVYIRELLAVEGMLAQEKAHA